MYNLNLLGLVDIYSVLDALHCGLTCPGEKHRANLKQNMKIYTLSIVREKLINVRPIFGLARHLPFQAK
jgi:hypothetical protein